MAKLIRIANQQPVILINPNPSDTNSKEVWAKCTPEIKSFALQNLKPGDDIDVLTENQADGLHILQIAKAGQLKPGTVVQAPPVTTSEPSKEQSSGKQGFRQDLPPNVQRSIIHQSTMASACNAVSAVASQISPNATIDAKTLATYIIDVYTLLLAEVEK